MLMTTSLFMLIGTLLLAGGTVHGGRAIFGRPCSGGRRNTLRIGALVLLGCDLRLMMTDQDTIGFAIVLWVGAFGLSTIATALICTVLNQRNASRPAAAQASFRPQHSAVRSGSRSLSHAPRHGAEPQR
jgi:predicted MFS family arabinose efflux permease